MPAGRVTRLGRWCAGAAAVTTAATAIAGETFEGVPEVEVAYYDVSGGDANAIRAAMNKVRPTDPTDHLRVDALTTNQFRWTWRTDGKTPCKVTDADVKLTLRVEMPRLANYAQLPSGLRKRWDAYLTGLKGHEAGHVRNAYDRKDDVAAAIRAAPCAGANEAAAAVLREIAEADRAFDVRTQHGRTQGFHFP